MRTLIAIVLAVPMVDLLLKAMLRRALEDGAVSLGPLGSLRLVGAPLWLARFRGEIRARALWLFWAAAAGSVMIFAAWVPISQVFAGLMLGGSLSNALERTWRGRVTDYVCLEFWPAFNLADVAITVGAAGLVLELMTAIRAGSFTT